MYRGTKSAALFFYPRFLRGAVTLPIRFFNKNLKTEGKPSKSAMTEKLITIYCRINSQLICLLLLSGIKSITFEDMKSFGD